MKKMLTFFLALFIHGVHAQPEWLYINFDTADYQAIQFDNTHHSNLWQAGTPVKTVFTTAYSGTRALVTDTVMPCNAGDTSVVTLFFAIAKSQLYHVLDKVSFWQRLDIDAGDTAYIEASYDGGPWSKYKTFTNAITGWQEDSFVINQFFQQNTNLSLRFTLINGGSTNARDGWMLDSFSLRYGTDPISVNDVTPTFASIYPNPANERLQVLCNEDATVLLTDITGRRIAADVRRTGSKEWNIDVSKLPAGSYHCIMRQSDGLYKQKIIVFH